MQSNKTGLYKRLSKEDEKSGESESIEHQGIILRQYAEEHGFAVVDEYADDGYSGTNFDRPEMLRMLEDAKSGKIDTIIVKDLSRFGRNYIEVGQYIDYIFPAYGIRFIAINDNVDTADRMSTAMDMMPIMNVFNEWHAANTSKKIRAVLQASQRSGKYTSWSYPYGYRAGADGKRTAVIDEEAAAVVRRIFDLRLQGYSAKRIARILTDGGIENPTSHYTKIDGTKRDSAFSPYWSPKTVRCILSNPTYLGKTIQHRTTRVSYKNHNVVNIPENEWIINDDAHEPIISREVWEKVQGTYGGVRGRADKKNCVHPLSGLVVCPDCGKKLKLKRVKDINNCFLCRTYVDLGKQYCTSHSISEKLLERVVSDDLRSMLKDVDIDEAKAKAHFLDVRSKSSAQNRVLCEKQLKEFKFRLAELDKLIEAAFEERVLGKLPESVCINLCEKYQAERLSVQNAVCETERKISAPESDVCAEEYIGKLREYGSVDCLTREMCLQLIDYVTVGDKPEEGEEREIRIYYKFEKI